MKYLYFLFFGVIYLLIRILELYKLVPYEWISFYITDLCAMPLVLGLLLITLVKLKKDKHQLPLWFIIGMTAYWSLYFEYYLPMQSENYTADLIDVGMYCLGSLSFIFWQNKYQKKRLA